MKYWIDTEFIENGESIDLISIGIVAEDGREFYHINWSCGFEYASKWVKENVLIHLPFKPIDRPSGSGLWVGSAKEIGEEVAYFMGCEHRGIGKEPSFQLRTGVEPPEIWGYYADYDWVVFCQMFGKMIDLPKGFPMYCRDLKQWCDALGNPKLPEQGKGEHHALADARWNKEIWEFLRQYEQDCVVERK